MASQEKPKDFISTEIMKKIQTGEFIIGEKHGKSKAWLVFAEILKENGEAIQSHVFCKNCKKVFKFFKQTSNLVKHKCFLDLYDPQTAVEPEHTKNLSQIIMNWLIRECHSHDLLKSEGLRAVFKELLKIGSKFGSDLNIGNLLPSPSDITGTISEIYKKCYERVKTEMASLKEQGFGLTVVIRSDILTNHSCIAVTVHYMKNKNITLRFLGFRMKEGGNTTSQDISREINKILDDFGCTLSNNKSMLVADLSNPCIKAVPDVHHIPCMSQLISDALLTSMESIPEVLAVKNACTDLVKYLTREGHDAILADLVTSSYQTAWITTYKMMNCIETNWSEIENVLRYMNEKARILSLNVNHLKAVIKFLQPFEEAIETLEDDTSPTLHLVIVYLHELKKTCDTDDEFQDFEFIEQLKENLRSNLQKIEIEHVTILHKLALFLYPPTNKLLQYNYKEKKVIEDECIRLMENYKDEVKTIRKTETGSPPSEPPESKRRKLFLDFIEPQPNNNVNEHYNHEIELYKNTRVMNSTDLDVFNWWQLQKDTFPLLYKISYTVLATPATCVAAKRILFKRKSLNEPKIEKILFVNANAKPDELESYFSILEQD